MGTNLAVQRTLSLSEGNNFAWILENYFPGFNINIFEKARMRKGWRIERRTDSYSLIIPGFFANAPDEIKIALLKWAQILVNNKFSRKDSNCSIKSQIKDLESTIYGFIRTKIGAVGRRTIYYPQVKFADTRGKKYDLREIFDRINNEYFDGGMECFLRWGKGKSRTSYHAICNDEKGKPYHLITIAGVYNLKNIPDFAIEAVMYHEMLHVAFPPIEVGAKRNIHHRKFREMEREFPHYEKWKRWQSTKRR